MTRVRIGTTTFVFPYWNGCQSGLFYGTKHNSIFVCKSCFQTKPTWFGINNSSRRTSHCLVRLVMQDKTKVATNTQGVDMSTQDWRMMNNIVVELGDNNFHREQNISQASRYSDDSDIYVDLADSPHFQRKPAGAISLAWLHFQQELDGLVRKFPIMRQYCGVCECESLSLE